MVAISQVCQKKYTMRSGKQFSFVDYSVTHLLSEVSCTRPVAVKFSIFCIVTAPDQNRSVN